MKIYVDRNLCENHGQCALVAPSVFTMNADGILEYTEDGPDSDRTAIEEAADLCPVQAIFLDRD